MLSAHAVWSRREWVNNFELQHEDPLRKALFQRNLVILTLGLCLKIAKAEFQTLSRLIQIQTFRTQTYNIWVRYPTILSSDVVHECTSGDETKKDETNRKALTGELRTGSSKLCDHTLTKQVWSHFLGSTQWSGPHLQMFGMLYCEFATPSYISTLIDR